MTIDRKLIYISGPMTGHESLNERMFLRAVQFISIRYEKSKVVTPFDLSAMLLEKHGFAPTDYFKLSYDEYLSFDIQWIRDNQPLIYLLPYWWDSNGAISEVIEALKYSNTFMYLKEHVSGFTQHVVPVSAGCSDAHEQMMRGTASLQGEEIKTDRYTHTFELKHPEQFVKHDTGKLQWSKFPFHLLSDTMQVLQYGANKYSWNNWHKAEKDDAIQRYSDALLRHVFAYASGEKTDPESGFSHLAHAMCNVLFLTHFEGMGDSPCNPENSENESSGDCNA